MTRRGLFLAFVAALAGSAAIASITMLAPPPPDPLPEPPLWDDDVLMPPYRTPAQAVVVRMFQGRLLSSENEVEVTTIFPGPGFTMVPDAGEADPRRDATDEADGIADHLRGIFSLGEVRALGASRVPLTGGSALVHEGDAITEIRLQGRPVGLTAVRLVVSQRRDGEEVMATSVLARRGKTIVLAGASGGGDGDLTLVSLTPQ